MMKNTVELVTAENDQYAKLIVPTQSSGATITMTSTEVGGDTFSVGGSSGSVKENSYEDYVTRLFIHKDHVEIGCLLGSSFSDKRSAKQGGEPERTIRISLDKITDVRESEIEGYPGMVFETAEDVYQFKFAEAPFSHQDNVGIPGISDAIEIVKNSMGGPLTKTGENASDDNSFIDELERLDELRERGVLSEQEFEKAKQELLE